MELSDLQAPREAGVFVSYELGWAGVERATLRGINARWIDFYGEVSSLLMRSSSCCVPVLRAVGFGWAGRRSS